MEILTLIAQWLNSKEIAKELGNSKKTIDSVRIDMLRRFQVKNAAHLVAFGFRKGWLK